jgi:hypothetical protein
MIRILFGLSVLCLAAAALQAAEPAFKIQQSKPNDMITVRSDDKRTVVEIVSESGIGKATIERTDGPWPRDVTIRLRYKADKAFTTLEGFRLNAERIRVDGNSKSSGQMRFFLADAQGKFPSDEKSVAGSLNITVKPVDKALEVTLPANLLQGTRKIELEWIDFFRG